MKEERITLKTDYSRYQMNKRELLIHSLTGIGIGLFVVWICYHSLLALPLSFLIAVVYVNRVCQNLCKKRKQLLHYHFKDFLSSLHTGMLAGYSLENAIKGAERELERLYGREDVLCRELQALILQMDLQVPAEKLFREFGKRSQVEDIRTFGEILMIAKRTGGNMNQVLQSTWQNLCEKIDTQREVDTVTAARKYEMKVMSVMPAGIILYLRLTFGGFMEKLYGNLFGILVMTGCLAIYAAALWIGQRMTEIYV